MRDRFKPRPMLTSATTTADNLRRMLALRAISLLAALLMALLAKPLFHILPDLDALLTICAVWAVFGIATWLRTLRPDSRAVQRHELLLHLATDIILLTVFLAFCGGTANPLTALYLMPVAVAAALLSPTLAFATAATAVAAYALLWKVAVPITVEDMDAAMQMHLAGMWLTFVLSALLLVGVVARMSTALRTRDQHLAAARERSLRAERIGALGGLAAGAAHSLGTPLNTLTLLAEEIAADAPTGSQLAADADELLIQVTRCREIIDGLLSETGLARSGPESLQLESWLNDVIQSFRRLRGDCTPTLQIDAGLAQRLIHPDAALRQTLLDLLNNAADSCAVGVKLHVEFDDSEHVIFSVTDAGPGFSASALVHAGREPWSDKENGMGMGLYLASAAAERLGGDIGFRNLAPGAEVRLRIPIEALA